MTCDRALEGLLDVDFAELTNDVSPLSMHVRGCERCSRVAAALTADTRLLATRMSAVAGRPRTPLRRYAFAPVAVMAALLLMVSVRRQAPAPVVQAHTLAPVVVDSFPPSPMGMITPKASAVRPLRAYPRAIPMAAVKLNQSEPLVSASAMPIATAREISVTPPAGTRAAVMQTGNPKFVVVWLFDPEEFR